MHWLSSVGTGSYRGLAELVKRGVNGVGIPATIDLDMKGTEYTIGFGYGGQYRYGCAE